MVVASETVAKKFVGLRSLLQKYLEEGAVIAFSGGVDSAFLLWVADSVRKECGGSLVALTALSLSMPKADFEDAVNFAANLGIDHVTEESNEVSLPEYSANDRNRCYYCKSELFRIARNLAEERGFRWILYGYNSSDRDDSRPGHRAALENGVRSPLNEADLNKDEIRTIMRWNNLELSEKPSSPCLSSRIMTGVPISVEKLNDVEALESILKRNGIRIFRVRLCGKEPDLFLRIETDPAEMQSVLKLRDQLVREGRRRGYRWVTLDLGGYKTGGGVS
jgi:uncharacterized protein